MKISSLNDLEKLESQIASVLKKINLGDLLHSLHLLKNASEDIRPFMVAGVALFGARFCPPSKTSQLIKNYDIRYLVDISNQYYLADPIIFDKQLQDEFIESNPVFMMLRVVSSQFPFEPGLFSEFSRPALLFHEIPKQLQGLPDIPEFDFETKFQAVTGVSVIDFITTGFVIASASRGNFAVNQSYFTKMREQGINIPNETIRAVLSVLQADKFKLIELYEKRKNKDRRFRMYDFNPLLQYPIIKPCQDRQFSTSDKDFIHAPVSELVASRISTGIFYEMFNVYGTNFSNYFGFVFERYVGLVLENCLTSEQLISESDIRTFYPKEKGKVPDWVVIDGSTVVLLECKTTRFSRAAQAIASEDAVNSSLKQVKKGLKQLANFISACQAKVPELEKFHNCTTFKPILVSLEPLYLINCTFFQEHINSLLAAEGITGLDWQILSIDELEVLQPHIAAGFKLSQVLDDLTQKTFNNVLEDLFSQTNRTFADSFLYPKQEELYQRLAIPDKNIT
ncbi:MAG: hypothetical protein ACK5WC_01300 [Aphanizomenon sp.]|jgi:hypothetical protein